MMHGGSSSVSDAAAALELQESGWEQLRREARKLEGDLDAKLSSYARLAARFSSATAPPAASISSPTDRSSWKSVEFEIQSLLNKLQDVNDAMSRCAAPAAPTTSVSQKLARHRDIRKEFRRSQLRPYKLEQCTEDFQLALFKNRRKDNLFANRAQCYRNRLNLHEMGLAHIRPF